jgi:hypothetical protein
MLLSLCDKTNGMEKIHFSNEQVDRMVELFEERLSLKKIGMEFGVAGPTIKKQLELRGCIIKQRRHEITEGYFKEIDTEEKAYWLGFLAADGCIRRRINEKGKTRGDSIILKLSVLDEDHLKRFKNSICPTAKISHYVSEVVTKKGYHSVSKACILRIHGNEIVQDIIKLGVGPRKTFIITKPNIDEKYYRHYIRGFFDGDGCCYIKSKKGRRGVDVMKVQYSIACASKNLRDFFSEELDKQEITNVCHDELSVFIRGGFMNFKKFFDYLYKDSTIYLERKYNKGMEFINYFKSLSDDPFINEYVYNPDVKRPDEIWTDEELKTLIETNNKVPYAYLTGFLIPNKSKQQIMRMKNKLGLKSKRKINGYLKMKEKIKNGISPTDFMNWIDGGLK